MLSIRQKLLRNHNLTSGYVDTYHLSGDSGNLIKTSNMPYIYTTNLIEFAYIKGQFESSSQSNGQRNHRIEAYLRKTK